MARPIFLIAGYTLPSERHPERNEDTYFINEKTAALGVFDGVGGAPGSEEASLLAAQTIARLLGKQEGQITLSLASQQIRDALQKAHEQIVVISKGKGHIATTATVAKLFQTRSGATMVIGSVGDTRAYLFRDGRLTFVTLDQSDIPEGIDPKKLQGTLAEVTELGQLNYEERRAFYNRNIIMGALGDESHPPEIAIHEIKAQPGDRLLLTSDGVHDNLTTFEIEGILAQFGQTDEAAEVLVLAAQRRSDDGSHFRAKLDDITAAILDYQPE